VDAIVTLTHSKGLAIVLAGLGAELGSNTMVPLEIKEEKHSLYKLCNA